LILAHIISLAAILDPQEILSLLIFFLKQEMFKNKIIFYNRRKSEYHSEIFWSWNDPLKKKSKREKFTLRKIPLSIPWMLQNYWDNLEWFGKGVDLFRKNKLTKIRYIMNIKAPVFGEAI